MKRDVKVLEKMIENYNMNIEMFSKYKNVEDRLAHMVANRRLVAAMIENDGESVAPRDTINDYVFFDSMMYAACAGEEIK